MNESNVAERLKTFIEMKGLTYSQFADTCGIPRPSLSQLLTGRNKKISDVLVGQIHNMFPELSIVWLLFGEGPIENNLESNSASKSDNDDSNFDDSLFSYDAPKLSDSKKIVFSHGSEGRGEILEGERLKLSQNLTQAADLKIEKLQNKIKELQSQIENLKKNPRKVAHITVYYDDNTFETFFPK